MRPCAVMAAALLGFVVNATASEPALELETLAGDPIALALRDDERVLLVHFWATWCPECEDELPILAQAKARCAASGVRIVTVSVGEDRETLVDYLAENGLALRPLRDPRGRTWRSLGGVGLPTNLTWTRAGRRTEVGPRDTAAWRETLRQLGCEPSPV